MAQKTNRFEGLNDDLAEFHIAKALLVRSESMFILFLGIALLLYFRLDPWIIPFGVVIHHTGDILVKRIKKPGESTSILMFILWAANIAVEILVLSFIFSRLLSHPVSATVKNLIMVFSIIYLILGLVGSMITKKGMVFFVSVFVPLNALLWRYGYAHRRELVWLFGAEALVFLAWGLIRYFTFDAEKEAEIRMGKVQSKLNKAKQTMQNFKQNQDNWTDAEVVTQQLEGIEDKLDKAKHVMEQFGISSDKLDKVSHGIEKAIKLTPITLDLSAYQKERYGFIHPIFNSTLYKQEPLEADDPDAFPAWRLSFELPQHLKAEQAEFEADIRSFLQDKYPDAYLSLKEIEFK